MQGPAGDKQGERLATMVRLLGEEVALYGELVGLAREKQRALVGGKLSDLERVLNREQELLRTVAEVEEARYALQCDLASYYGMTPGELTVTRLAEAVGSEYAPLLTEKQQALAGLIGELTVLNQANAELIQQSLAYIAFTMDALTGEAGATYGGDGRRQRGPASLRLFSRHA